MNPISLDKEYRTRDGRTVTVVTLENCSLNYPVGALVQVANGVSYETYTHTGWFNFGPSGESHADLVEVKPRIKRTYWVNVYPEFTRMFNYASKQHADTGAASDRVATVKVEIDCEHGEGLQPVTE